MQNSSRLGKNASAAFEEADAGRAPIYIPTIVLAELYFLNVKYNHPIDFAAAYRKLEAEDVLDFDADAAVKEMHDRMIVGVSRRLNAACLTKDASIANSGLVKIIW